MLVLPRLSGHAGSPTGAHRHDHARGPCRKLAKSPVGHRVVNEAKAVPLRPQQDLELRIVRSTGETVERQVRCRIDTDIEIDYYRHGGILPYVLRRLIGRTG